MNFQDAEEAVRREDAATAEALDAIRKRARGVILHALDNLEGSRLSRPDNPHETTGGQLAANFAIRGTMNEIIRMTTTESGAVKLERGAFTQQGFHPAKNVVVGADIPDAMKALVRLSKD